MPSRKIQQIQLRRSARQNTKEANNNNKVTHTASNTKKAVTQSPKHPSQPKTMPKLSHTNKDTTSTSKSDMSTDKEDLSTSIHLTNTITHYTTSSNSSNAHSTSSDTNTHSTPSEQTTCTRHKTVNHQSTNCRQYKQVSKDLSRSTPDQNNLSQCRHSHSTRLTLKINYPSSDNAEEMILTIFSEFVQELINSDPTAAILPWKSIHRSKGSISKTSEIPKNTKLLRPYLNRFFNIHTPDLQFATYPGVHIGHNKSLSDLCEDMQLWLQDGDHGLYYKMLQVEDSAEIGWFFTQLKRWMLAH
jgi:hypothetical protein